MFASCYTTIAVPHRLELWHSVRRAVYVRFADHFWGQSFPLTSNAAKVLQSVCLHTVAEQSCQVAVLQNFGLRSAVQEQLMMIHCGITFDLLQNDKRS